MDKDAWRMRCFSCMEQLDSVQEICPRCGWDNHNRANGEGMLEQTVLHDQYLVGRALGRGGFGVTYMGFDMNLKRRVAIKEFFPVSLAYRCSDTMRVAPYTNEAKEYSEGLRRAYDEGETVAKLGNISNIVQVHNAFEANGTVYIVMEYIDGTTLAKMVKHNGPMGWRQALELMTPIMRALEKVHAQDVIHRDVSPDNIMLSRKTGETVLLDFGAAREARAGLTTTLRPGFAPLEQYSESVRQDGRVDVYALCATIYFLVTGRVPESADMRMYADRTLPSPRSLGFDVAPRVEVVLLKGMSVKREDRYPSMTALREAFEAAAGKKHSLRPHPSDGASSGGGVNKQIRRPGPSDSRSRSGGRRALAVVLAVAMLGTAGVVVWKITHKDDGGGGSTTEVTASHVPGAAATDGQATAPGPTPTPLSAAVNGATDENAEYVWSPSSGLYYHSSQSCPAIEQGVQVWRVTREIAENSRQQSPCPDCIGGGSAATFYATLTRGDKSDAVLELQNRLYELGFLLDDPDGAYGSKTLTAVKLFQQAAGLEPTGIADNETQQRLYAEDAPRTEFAAIPTPAAPADGGAGEEASAAGGYTTLQKGDKNDQVQALKARLYELGFMAEGSKGGAYGSKTEAAVKLFQQAVGLEPTGIADNETQQRLYAEDAPRVEAATPIPSPTSTVTPVPQVQFGTEGMEAAVRAALDRANGPILAEDLSRVERLDLGGKAIADLGELALFPNLTWLSLADSGIRDISALSGLKNLKHLSVTDNDISDISPLVSLSGLEMLDISGNPIGDISALSGLTHLKYLWMDGLNEGVDLSPLLGLDSLEEYTGPAVPWPTGRDATIISLWRVSDGDTSKAALESAFEAVGIGTGSLVAGEGRSVEYLDGCITGAIQPDIKFDGICLFAYDGQDYSGPLARAVTRGVAVHTMSADDPEGIYDEICALYGVNGAFARAGTVAWPTDPKADIAVIYTESAASDGLVEALERASAAAGGRGNIGSLYASESQSLSYLKYCVSGEDAGAINAVLLFPYEGVDYSEAISLANQRGVAVHVVTSVQPADLFDEICALFGKANIENPYR